MMVMINVKALPMNKPVIIAVSSSALFDLAESDALFRHQGLDAYTQYQIAHEHQPLDKGIAFNLVERILQFNEKNQQHFEVTLISRNSADTGLRIFNSIEHYQLPITKAGFTSGQSPCPYLKAFGCHLFLSENESDIRLALNENLAAAKILQPHNYQHSEKLHIAFDGDAVLFSDESERIYQESGLETFLATEKEKSMEALKEGPFKQFLTAVYAIQSAYKNQDECPIRTALVTARCAPAHARVVHTLRAWDIRIDEAFFLGGLNKSDILKAFKADIFFDDQKAHCQKAKDHVTTAHVPHGVMNHTKKKETISE